MYIKAFHANQRQVHYTPHNVNAARRGGAGYKRDELVLEPFEIITAVEGKIDPYIVSLTLTTNKRTLTNYTPTAVSPDRYD